MASRDQPPRVKSRRASGALWFLSSLGLLACGAQEEPLFRSAPSAQTGANDVVCAETSDQAGKLDQSFGQNGSARIKFGADDDGGFFGLELVGDKIVAGGWGTGGLGGVRFRVSRVSSDGSLDQTFGQSGSVLTPFAISTADAVYAVAVGHQQNGNIVALGYRAPFHTDSANIALVRYLPNGALDGSFGKDGKSLIDLGDEEEIADGLVLPDDKMIVAGSRGNDLLVARIDVNGALDTSFGSPHGYVTTHLGAKTSARSIVLARNGDFLVTGAVEAAGHRDGIVLCFSPSGALVPMFGAGGKIVQHDDTLEEESIALSENADGSFVVAAHVGPADARFPEVRRYLSNGSPDTSFGAEGVARATSLLGTTSLEDMVVLAGGGVLLAGNAGMGHPVLIRTTCKGEFDPAFGTNGALDLDIGEYGLIHRLLVDSNERVLVGGADVGETPGPGTYGVIVRMHM